MNNKELEEIFTLEFCESIPEIKQETVSFIGSVLGTNENRLAALLMYCFSNEEGHNIYQIFIEALNECLKNDGQSYFYFPFDDDYEVLHEKQSEDGRIDLILKTIRQEISEQKAIIIELKLNSFLHNDLEDYFNSINDCKDENKVGIVLSLNDISNTIEFDKFHFISLHDYLNTILELNKEEKYSSEFSLQEKHFLNDFQYYVENVTTFYFNPLINEILSFYLKFTENNKKLKDLDIDSLSIFDTTSTFKDKINKTITWHLEYSPEIRKLKRNKEFAIEEINMFLATWAQTNQIGKHRGLNKMFFKERTGSLIGSLYRICFDYTNLDSYVPNFKLSLDFNKEFPYEEILEIDINAAKEIVKLELESDTFKKVDKHLNEWNSFLEIEYTIEESIFDFYDFFQKNIKIYIQKIETVIYDKILFLFKDKYEKTIINGLETTFLIDKEGICISGIEKTRFNTFYYNTEHKTVLMFSWNILSIPTVTLYSAHEECFNDWCFMFEKDNVEAKDESIVESKSYHLNLKKDDYYDEVEGWENYNKKLNDFDSILAMDVSSVIDRLNKILNVVIN